MTYASQTRSTKPRKQRIQEAHNLIKEFAKADFKEHKEGGLYATVGTTQIGIDCIDAKGVRLFVKSSGDYRFKAIASISDFTIQT